MEGWWSAVEGESVEGECRMNEVVSDHTARETPRCEVCNHSVWSETMNEGC